MRLTLVLSLLPFFGYLLNRVVVADSSQFLTPREHDELRYSVRSVMASFPPSLLGNFHLIVGDTPDYPAPPREGNDSETNSNASKNGRIAQIPWWLDFEQARLSSLPPIPISAEGDSGSNDDEAWEKNVSGAAANLRNWAGDEEETEGPQFIIHPHSEIFKTAAFLEVAQEIKLDKEAVLEQDIREAKSWRNTFLPTFNS